MRLSPSQLDMIRTTVDRHLGAGSVIWLFGSRVRDEARGGDVDLYVEPPRAVGLRQELRCRADLAEGLDLDVDLIVGGATERPIAAIAKANGVRL